MMEINEETLDKIEPSLEDFIDRRINHKSFAKIIFWLCFKAQGEDFIYASELSSFMKYSQNRAYTVLRELCKAGLIRRNEKTSNIIEFHFVKNGNTPIVNKYLEKSKKIIGID